MGVIIREGVLVYRDLSGSSKLWPRRRSFRWRWWWRRRSLKAKFGVAEAGLVERVIGDYAGDGLGMKSKNLVSDLRFGKMIYLPLPV